MAYQQEGQHPPMSYQIRLKGHLDPHWAAWFDGMTITQDNDGDTLLTGPVVDQAALHGVLKKVRDLGLPLIAVVPVQHAPEDSSTTEHS